MRRSELSFRGPATCTAPAVAWLAIGLGVVTAANVWPLDIVPIEAWSARAAAILHQGVDIGTLRTVLVWVVLGGLAAVAFAGVQRWRSRALVAGGLLAAALAIEWLQVMAAARHPSFADGVLSGVAGGLPVLLVRPSSAALGRWLWALSALALAAMLVVLPALALKAAARQPLANWSTGFPLVAGAEANGQRVWQGSLGTVQVFARPLGSDALTLLTGLPDGEAAPALADPDVARRLGEVFRHTIDGPAPGAGTPLLTGKAADDMVGAIQAGGGFAIVLTATPQRADPHGQPRLLTLSPDPYRRNVTIGQEGADLYVRIRTPWSGTNGTRQGLSVWPNVFAAGGPRRIGVRHDGKQVEVFVNGQRAGAPVALYRPRLDLGHDGPAGDLALVALLCGATGALAGIVAPRVPVWLGALVLAPGLVAQTVLGPPAGMVWTLCLVLAGVGVALAGLALADLARARLAEPGAGAGHGKG